MRKRIRTIAFVTAVCVSACGSIPRDVAAAVVAVLAASPAGPRLSSPAGNGASVVAGEAETAGNAIPSSWTRAIVLLLIIVVVILLIYRTFKGWKPAIS